MFKFCPICSTELILKQMEYDHMERLVCPNCNWVYYNNSKPTASGLIVNENNEILLVKRSWHPFIGYYDIAGGFLENNEHPKDGLKREIMEELNVGIEIINDVFDIAMGIYSDGTDESKEKVSGYGVSTLNIYYICKIIDGMPKASDEIASFEWIAFEKLNSILDKVAFKCNQSVLKKLLSTKRA